jgi:flagellin-specific chaperone FliS
MKKDKEIILEVDGFLVELLETWREAMKNAPQTVKEMNNDIKRSKFDIET